VTNHSTCTVQHVSVCTAHVMHINMHATEFAYIHYY